MNNKCDVVAVVLNWRTPDLAEACVRSLLNAKFSGILNITVIDNNSHDGSADRLRSTFGDAVEVIESDRNNGYAGGMNIGLGCAIELSSKYALLLNADIEVNETTIENLYNAAEELEGAFYGPRIYDLGKTTDRWFIGGRWDWWQGTIRIVRDTIDSPAREPRNLEFVNGAAMFIRLSAIKHIGMFDASFGLYFEESDLCSRASRAGYKLWHVPTASVLHIGGVSTSKAQKSRGIDAGQYYRTRNRLLWGKKNLTGLRAMVFWLNVILRLPIKLLSLVLSRRFASATGMVLGIRDFFLGRYGMFDQGNDTEL